MAEGSDQLADGLDIDFAGDGRTSFLAEESGFDRHVLWRLASWGVAAVGAVTLAVFADQWSTGLRRDSLASTDLTRQSQQIKSIVGDSQIESRRLSSAIETLNADRDRLYSRVTVLEQGLDTVTGSISRQIRSPDMAQSSPNLTSATEMKSASQSLLSPAGSPSSTKPIDKGAGSQPRTVPQAVAPVQTTAPAITSASATLPSKSTAASSEPATPKRAEPTLSGETAAAETIASVASPKTDADSAPPASSNIAIQRTDFGIDLGSAGSLEGLRVLWQSLMKSNKALSLLRPIVVVKETGTGLGMQLRLVAGPLGDAAAAAKICATLSETNRSCETTVFDGQRLAMKDDPPIARRPIRKRVGAKKPPAASPLSFLGR